MGGRESVSYSGFQPVIRIIFGFYLFLMVPVCINSVSCSIEHLSLQLGYFVAIVQVCLGIRYSDKIELPFPGTSERSISLEMSFSQAQSRFLGNKIYHLLLGKVVQSCPNGACQGRLER